MQGTLTGGEIITVVVGPLKLPVTIANTNGMFKVTTYVKGKGTDLMFEVDAG